MQMFDVPLTTGAVVRSLEPWHADEFAAHMERASDHIRPWVGPAFIAPGLAGARATLTRYAESAARDGARIYGIWDAQVLVGGVMFVEFNAASGGCEIGCWLEPAAEGRGHITAASGLLLRYAFEDRRLHRAEWRCRSDNERSFAVARRLGMTREGELREAWPVDGVFYNKVIWSILDREWSPQPSA